MNKCSVSRIEFYLGQDLLMLIKHEAVVSKLEQDTATKDGCHTLALMTKRKHSVRKVAQRRWFGMDSGGWFVRKRRVVEMDDMDKIHNHRDETSP